jgi:hypothetical protein
MDPHFLGLCSYWRVFVTFTLLSSYPRKKSPRYAIDRLGGSQSRSGRHGEDKILHPTGARTLGRPARSQSLYRLRRSHYAIPDHELKIIMGKNRQENILLTLQTESLRRLKLSRSDSNDLLGKSNISMYVAIWYIFDK